MYDSEKQMIKAINLPPLWGYNIHVFDHFNQTNFKQQVNQYFSQVSVYSTIGPWVGFENVKSLKI